MKLNVKPLKFTDYNNILCQWWKKAIELLIEHITEIAKTKGYKYSYALIKNKPLIDTYKKIGYVEGSSYTSEMIKVL